MADITAIDKAIDAIKPEELNSKDGLGVHQYPVSENSILKLKQVAKKLAKDPEILSGEFRIAQAAKEEASFNPKLVEKYKDNLALRDKQMPDFTVVDDVVTMSANGRSVSLTNKEASQYKSIEEGKSPKVTAIMDLLNLMHQKIMNMGYATKDDNGRKILSTDGEFITAIHSRARGEVEAAKQDKSSAEPNVNKPDIGKAKTSDIPFRF